MEDIKQLLQQIQNYLDGLSGRMIEELSLIIQGDYGLYEEESSPFTQ